jgi:CubicO group peptidase (beta-lactamase class C family)
LLPTTVPCELPPWQQPDSDWNWNSRYWRTLGAPWGGMISTVEDLGKLASMILRGGRDPAGDSILLNATVRTSTCNQTRHFSELAEADRVQRPWGLGWRFNWLDHSSCFSDFLPENAFGHWGATGTLMWIDPASDRWCVILSNQPYEDSQSVIQRMSSTVAACFPNRSSHKPPESLE